MSRIESEDEQSVRFNPVENAVGSLAVIAIFAMMLLVFADVISRYVFSAPITGAYQLGALLLVVVIFTGLPLASSMESHLTVGFVDHLFKGRVKTVQQVLVNFLSGAIMLVVGWRLIAQARYFTIYPEVLEVLDIGLAVLCYFMSVMATITSLVHFAFVWRYLQRPSDTAPNR